MNRAAPWSTPLIIALLSMIGPFATGTVFPGFASIGAQFDVNDAALQQLISVYLLAFALTSLFHGPISDAVGRKPVMVIGTFLFVLSSIGCAFAPSLNWLLAYRALQGASAGAGQIIARALVRDLYEGPTAQKVMAQISMIFGVAPAFAPVIGGWLTTVGGWRSVFWWLAGYSLILVVVVAIGLPETHGKDARTPFRLRPVSAALFQVAKSWQFERLSLSSSFAFAAQFIYISSAPILIVRLMGLGETDFWVLFVPMISGMIVGSYLNARLSGRVAPVRLASIGFAIMVISAVMTVVAAHVAGATLPWVVIGPVVTSLGAALGFPIIQLAMLDMFPTMRGSAASMQAFFVLLLNAVIAGVIVPIAAVSVENLAYISAGFAVLAAALWWWHLSVRPKA